MRNSPPVTGSPTVWPAQVAVPAFTGLQAICSPGLALVVVGMNAAGTTPSAALGTRKLPVTSWPVLVNVPAVPAPVMVQTPPITFVHGVPPVIPEDGGFDVLVIEPGAVEEIWLRARPKPKCASGRSTTASGCVTTDGPLATVSAVGAASAGGLRFARNDAASNSDSVNAMPPRTMGSSSVCVPKPGR